MEVFITNQGPGSPSDPLTRLLAAILAWLRALLAEHQATLLAPAPSSSALPPETTTKPRHTAKRSRARHAGAPPRIAPRPMPMRPRAVVPRAVVPRAVVSRVVNPRVVKPWGMTAGLPRPRLVAPS